MADEQNTSRNRKKHGMAETDPHSERISDTPSRQQKEEREREASIDKPDGGDGRKPTELRTTSRSELDDRIEEKEGHQVARTREEMSLHEEISQAGKGKGKGKDRGKGHA